MFKNIIIAVSLFIATVAFAQSTCVTIETNSKGAQNISTLYTDDNLFVFANYCEGNWWQAYAGATYSPDEHIQAAFGIGAETEGFRWGGWFWAGEGKASLTHCVEGAGSGSWHRTIAKYAVSDKLTLGVTDRSFYGKGVRAEIKLGRSSKLILETYDSGKSTAAISTTF